MEERSVLIIGGGAFGTSAAYHLAQRGYKKVTVLDRFMPPSRDAAATDINKTIRYDYAEDQYAQLAAEAMEVWRDAGSPVSGLFRQSGWVMASNDLAKDFIDAVHTQGKGRSQHLTVKQLKERWPEFTGTFAGWYNLWGPEAGWVS